MTHRVDSTAINDVMEVLVEQGLDGIPEAARILLNEAMKLERSTFLEAGAYERTDERRGYANGYKPKKVNTRIGEMELSIPQVRGLGEDAERFYPQALERGLRSERALKLAIAEMYVQGVSTRKVKEITQKLCGGMEVSSTTVSRAAAQLDDELERWRNRPIGEIPYLALDARYEKVRHAGSVIDCAVLLAIGVRRDGWRTVLGVSVSLSEAEVHWREFLTSLQERGLHGVRMVVSDDHAGLRQALKARMAGIPWQRCQFHLQQNAQAYVPQVGMRKEVAQAIREIFGAPSREEAERRLAGLVTHYSKTAPRLAQWAEANIPEGLTVFMLPPYHRTRMRTTNGLERLSKEINRRTRVATLFPNEASVLRLVSAVLMETSEEWETKKVYLNMESA